MTTAKKVELGTLYLAGPDGAAIPVRPADGKKFTYDEWKLAVGGYVEAMLPAAYRHNVWVNEEGVLPNRHTWAFANRHVYVDLNFYPTDWLVTGNALETWRVTPEEYRADLPTVKEALQRTATILSEIMEASK
jgi:hypothetical protein